MAHPAARHSTDQIYSVLRTDVISGALKPRESMSEARMALRFGVSRTPVREAFKRLVDEGFLVAVPQVGGPERLEKARVRYNENVAKQWIFD